MKNTFFVFDRSRVFKSSLIAILASLFVLTAFSGVEAKAPVQKKAGSIRLTARFPKSIKKPKFWLSGKTEPRASLEFFLDGQSQGFLTVSHKGRFKKLVSISVGTHTFQLVAKNTKSTNSLSGAVTRKASWAVDLPLGLGLIHSHNVTRKSTLSFYGSAFGVNVVRVAVNGTDRGYITVNKKSGRYNTRVGLTKGSNTIAVTAVNALYNVTATKRVIRK